MLFSEEEISLGFNTTISGDLGENKSLRKKVCCNLFAIEFQPCRHGEVWLTWSLSHFGITLSSQCLRLWSECTHYVHLCVLCVNTHAVFMFLNNPFTFEYSHIYHFLLSHFPTWGTSVTFFNFYYRSCFKGLHYSLPKIQDVYCCCYEQALCLDSELFALVMTAVVSGTLECHYQKFHRDLLLKFKAWPWRCLSERK